MARRGARAPVPPAPKPARSPSSARELAHASAESDDSDLRGRASRVGERMRRGALGLTTALLTARAFWPSEPDLKEGAGAGLIWVLVLLVAAGLGLASSLIAGHFRFRWSWT